MSNRAADVAWMGELRERVQAWLRAIEVDDEVRWNADAENTQKHGHWRANHTKDYIDLIFAFGLARIGAEAESRTLHQSAAASLSERLDGAHQFLLSAFSWRTKQAYAGRPHAGPLPESMYQQLEEMGRMSGYVVDRLRKQSRIVEPDVSVNPYRHWAARINEFEGQISKLQGQVNPEAFQSEADRLLTSREGAEGCSRIGLALLRQCSFAREDQIRSAVRDLLSREGFLSDSCCIDAWTTVTAALMATARFGFREEMLSSIGVVSRWATQDLETLSRFPVLIRSSIDALGAIDDISRTILGDLSPDEWIARAAPSDLPGARILLAVAERWYRFGRDGLAHPVIRGAISLLGRLREQSEEADRAQAHLADEIGQALRSASPPVPDGDIEMLLDAGSQFLASPDSKSHHHAARGFLKSIWNAVADPTIRSSIVTHATMREQSEEVARLQARLATEISQSLRSASRPVAAGHIATLFEALPRFQDGYTTRSHFHATALEFAESVCFAAVEVCSHG
jgi:hypothetical protein